MRKNFYLFFLFLIVWNVANAQIIRNEDLERYSKEKYGEKWCDAATKLAKTITLDQNHCLTFERVIEAKNQNKEQLYVLINYWVTQSFNDANSVIKLNDKDAGVVIVQGYCDNIAIYNGFANLYKIGIKPTIKIDIKDGKVRVTESIQYYHVNMIAGGGIGSVLLGVQSTIDTELKYLINECYPFVNKDKHFYNKKVASIALIMSNAYENILIDKIENAVTNGIVGNENEDW